MLLNSRFFLLSHSEFKIVNGVEKGISDYVMPLSYC